MGFGGKKRKSTGSADFKTPTKPPKRRSYAGSTLNSSASGGGKSILKTKRRLLTCDDFSNANSGETRSVFLNFLSFVDAAHKNNAAGSEHVELDENLRSHFYRWVRVGLGIFLLQTSWGGGHCLYFGLSSLGPAILSILRFVYFTQIPTPFC